MTIYLQLIGICIAIGSVIYAYMVNREKQKLENLIRALLQGFAGNICKILESAEYAWNHFVIIQDNVIGLDESKEKNNVLKSLQLGHGDITAAHRMLHNLLNEVLITQSGLFGTKIINYPQEKILIWAKSFMGEQ